MLKRIVNLKVNNETIQRVESNFKNAVFALLEFLGFFVGIPLIYKTHPIFGFVAGLLFSQLVSFVLTKKGKLHCCGLCTAFWVFTLFIGQ